MEVVVQNAEKKSRKAKKEEEVSESEAEEETDFEPSESEGSSSGSEESEAEVIVEKKKQTSLKRKMAAASTKIAVGPVPEPEKKKTKKEGEAKLIKEQPLDKEGEVSFVVGDEETNKNKRSPLKFETGRVDKNLHTDDPNNIVQKTVQISTGLKLTCKMLAGAVVSTGKVTYPDWAALIFQKKIKDDKCFEFNVNLRDAPKIIEGLKFIIEENKTFFN